MGAAGWAGRGCRQGSHLALRSAALTSGAVAADALVSKTNGRVEGSSDNHYTKQGAKNETHVSAAHRHSTHSSLSVCVG